MTGSVHPTATSATRLSRPFARGTNPKIRTAGTAFQVMRAATCMSRMQDRFFAGLVAGLTKVMRWLAISLIWLKRIDKNARWNLIKLVALFLCLPILKLHNLIFKLAYFIAHFQL